jgi:hypothetical protein
MGSSDCIRAGLKSAARFFGGGGVSFSWRIFSAFSLIARCSASLIAGPMIFCSTASSSLRTVAIWKRRPPISSVDCSPNVTRRGGLLGLRGFSAELSKEMVTSITVPFGSTTGCL